MINVRHEFYTIIDNHDEAIIEPGKKIFTGTIIELAKMLSKNFCWAEIHNSHENYVNVIITMQDENSEPMENLSRHEYFVKI